MTMCLSRVFSFCLPVLPDVFFRRSPHNPGFNSRGFSGFEQRLETFPPPRSGNAADVFLRFPRATLPHLWPGNSFLFPPPSVLSAVAAPAGSFFSPPSCLVRYGPRTVNPCTHGLRGGLSFPPLFPNLEDCFEPLTTRFAPFTGRPAHEILWLEEF